MGHSLHRTLLAALPASLAAALLAGCTSPPVGRSGAGADGAGPGRPAAVEIPKITTAVIDPVPVEAYLLTEEQWTELGRAESVLRVRCMKRFGITYDEPMPTSGPTGQRISQYRYGKLDPSQTAVHGYENPGAHSSGTESDAEMRAAKEQRTEVGPRERMVLQGTDKPGEKTGKGGQDFNGRTVPEGGCIGEAQQTLGNYGDVEIANDVNLDSFGRSLRDERVLAVFAKWSRCMERKGYHYRTPVDASSDKKWSGEKASPEEKTVATTDAVCKMENNVAGVWYAVDVAYQKQAIERHAEELDQVRKSIEAQLKVAGEVLKD
ncbi:hypothetical protein [Streptomyces fulvorobeus]|uniref:Lipoprotein n=1 Tax=Streptomyces fulvorobeus TaxID=284028 RepID=A0A7J0BZE1_9ACTN|nr:hypothetical protein [Streptomyces fulvorobeus]NYE39401.1 hypothetical protein [Streptomyces fulvorobeus]GFM95629.1 hypothetical protein Sfulv_04400 [Streptomyces fulvorobeus]